MTDNLCKNCKYWRVTDFDRRYAEEYTEDLSGDCEAPDIHYSSSGVELSYNAEFTTRGGFGCVNFKPKEVVEDDQQNQS